MKSEYHVDDLSDDELLVRTGELVARGRRLEAVLVAHMAEVDARKLYLREACPSMFAYATERLGLSEAQAYERITVARTSRRFPAVLEMLADGRLSLTAAARLGPHITGENAAEVLPRAVHATKREVQALVAELAPAPDVPPIIRKLPQASRPAEVRPAGAPAPPAALVPIAPARFKVQFTAGAELEGKLARARALLRHQIPDGDLAAIVDRAVTVLLRDLERKRFAATEKPRRSLADADVTPRSRHIPAPVRRAVWERDGAQCTFVDKGGRRCAARERLQFHHQAPYGRGGDHDPSNVRLLCGAHNRYHAEIDFGRETVEQHVNEARRARRDNRARGSRAEEGNVTWPAVRRPRDHVGGGGRKPLRKGRARRSPFALTPERWLRPSHGLARTNAGTRGRAARLEQLRLAGAHPRRPSASIRAPGGRATAIRAGASSRGQAAAVGPQNQRGWRPRQARLIR